MTLPNRQTHVSIIVVVLFSSPCHYIIVSQQHLVQTYSSHFEHARAREKVKKKKKKTTKKKEKKKKKKKKGTMMVR